MEFLDIEITNGTEATYTKYKDYFKDSDYKGYLKFKNINLISPFFIKDKVITHLFSPYDGKLWQKKFALADKSKYIYILESLDYFNPSFERGIYFNNINDKTTYFNSRKTFNFKYCGNLIGNHFEGEFGSKVKGDFELYGTFKLKKL